MLKNFLFLKLLPLDYFPLAPLQQHPYMITDRSVFLLHTCILIEDTFFLFIFVCIMYHFYFLLFLDVLFKE